MDAKTLSDVLITIVKSQRLMSQSDIYEIIGRFSTGILLGEAVPNETVSHPGKIAPPPPAADMAPGAVIIKNGQRCECVLCDKLIYDVVADVFENTTKKVFVAAFKPSTGVPPLAMPLDVWTDPYGNMAIDCPVCKGVKTLWIKGKGDKLFSDYPTGGEALNKQ